VDKGREPHPDPNNAPQQAKEAFAVASSDPTSKHRSANQHYSSTLANHIISRTESSKASCIKKS